MKLLQNENYVCMGGDNSSENWELLDSSVPSDYVILGVLSPEGLISDGVPPGLMEVALMCQNGTKYRHLRDDKLYRSIMIKAYQILIHLIGL